MSAMCLEICAKTVMPVPAMPPGGAVGGTGITVFAQISRHMADKEAPPPPPETFGAYSKKTEENTGVIGMIDLLIKDLDKEMTEGHTEEKDSQADYEEMMKMSAEKRTSDSKTLTGKEATKASLEGDLDMHNDDKAKATAELAATNQYIMSLHVECDWLLKYFDMRKEARASEVDELGKAKAVLSGADYALLQTSHGYLRKA